MAGILDLNFKIALRQLNNRIMGHLLKHVGFRGRVGRMENYAAKNCIGIHIYIIHTSVHIYVYCIIH